MYNYNQERSSAKVQNQANPQQSKEKPNLFKRPEKQTEDYSLGEPNLDEPGNDFFYQKESFDNFYDTIKNDISPQKISKQNLKKDPQRHLRAPKETPKPSKSGKIHLNHPKLSRPD